VLRYINGGTPIPRETIESETLPRFLWYHARGRDAGFFVAIEKSSGRFIGWFHLRPDPDDSRPGETELGYRLRQDAWGLGFATEASRALVRKAFEELGMVRVTAWTMVVSARSRRVMEKAGLRLVKTVYRAWPDAFEGTEQGDVEYAIDRASWNPPLGQWGS
jgi:RimJ/RimL family protein N-acetyltransferase